MSCSSMTGFGQARYEGAQVRVLLELRTVNHRFCEWNVRLPRELLGMEEEVRARLATRVARGRGDLYLTLESGAVRAFHVDVAWPLMDALVGAHATAAKRYQLPSDEAAGLLHWLTFPDVMRVEQTALDVGAVAADVQVALDMALTALVETRRREGQRLALDMLAKVAELRGICARIEALASEVEPLQTDRLRKRMIGVAGGIDEARLLTEVAILVDRMSIDEEVVRLASHLDEFEATLQAEGSIGRRLDFIVQELYREVNTVGSKANHLAVSKLVVDAKVLIEQLREQAQNVE